jgi:uncharacterized protein affecting Mg2+/Co2+ transport
MDIIIWYKITEFALLVYPARPKKEIMMKKSITVVSVLVLLSILLGACNLTPATPTQVPADQINTIAAMTVQALTTQMAPPPATATNTPEPATATPAVTDTPTLLIPTLNLTPVGLATNTLIPLPTTAGAGQSSDVYFIKDETIPDNTCMAPGTTFAKTWSIRNNGSVTWNTAYMASMFANDPSSPAINGDGTIAVKVPVAPGAIWKYTANLIAPSATGTYTQSWKMQDDSGNWFGIGGPNGTPWTVVIKVAKDCTTSSNSGGLTLTTAISSPADGATVAAGATISVSGTIKLEGLGDGDTQDVTFVIRMGSTSMGCGDTKTFATDTTKTFSVSGCKVPSAYTAGDEPDISVYIKSPGGTNKQSTVQVTIS